MSQETICPLPSPVSILLTSDEDRLDLLAATGLDAVLVIEFTPEFAHSSPQRFVREVFVGYSANDGHRSA